MMITTNNNNNNSNIPPFFNTQLPDRYRTAESRSRSSTRHLVLMSHNDRDSRLEEEYGNADINDDEDSEVVSDSDEDNVIGHGGGNHSHDSHGQPHHRSDRRTRNYDGIDSDDERHRRPPPPSNEKLLCIAFVSFQCFAIMQMVVAWIAGSEAMIGDSFAMLVDAATYLLNWYAERQKGFYAKELNLIHNNYHCNDTYHDSPVTSAPDSITIPPNSSSNNRVATLKYKKYTYQLEIVTPFVTVSTLVLVIGLVLRESIHVLIIDSKRDVSEQDDPNVKLMLIFSVLNLFLDVINVFCFAQASHGLGYKTDVAEDDEDNKTDNGDEYDDDENDAHHHGKQDGSNLNMCSAWTHVMADTLRSLAVILAASLARNVSVITAEVADASAAVVVSVIILLSLLPLLRGMVQTYFALQCVDKQLRRIERGERSFSECDDEDDDDDDECQDESVGLVEMQRSSSKKANVSVV